MKSNLVITRSGASSAQTIVAMSIAIVEQKCMSTSGLQLAMAPCRKVTHVLEQMRPNHDAQCGVWKDKVGASALGKNVRAHVNANSSKLILHMHALLENVPIDRVAVIMFPESLADPHAIEDIL